MGSSASFSPIWDLDSLLPHPQTDAFREALAGYRNALTGLADESDRLPGIAAEARATDRWSDFLTRFAAVLSTGNDLASFIGCHAAADADNKAFQQIEAQLQALEPVRERIVTNIEFALTAAEEDVLGRFIQSAGYLSEIGYYLRDRRRFALLRLPKDQERLASELAVDGAAAWGRLYRRISGKLRIPVMERGKIVEKSPGQVQFDSPQRAVRENNFFTADAAWNTIADDCADALNHLAGTRLTIYRRLGVRDHLDVPLTLNRMQRSTLDAMWSAVAARKEMLVRYLRAKARLLGIEKLAWYDVSAPLSLGNALAGEALSYDDACGLVLETFGRFSPELGDFARRALAQRWVEAENRSGKRQGGFCTGFPTKGESRIFMTFTSSVDSMSTLAHELGHAYHSWVLRDRPIYLQEYPMNLAETASTFAEAVLGEERLRRSESADEQLCILENMLSDAVVYLMNIHARFVFEDRFHVERSGGELSAARLSQLMLAAQKETYCNALADDGWYPGFWISKLHFYFSDPPFYNFPYTFGSLLSLGLYALAGQRDFPEQYRRLLIATGCQDTEDAVRSTLGFDLGDTRFWHKSLDVVEGRVSRFLELADKRR